MIQRSLRFSERQCILRANGGPNPGVRRFRLNAVPWTQHAHLELAGGAAEGLGGEQEGASVAMSDNEVLVVASKVKNYIKTQGDMKTSSAVLEVLSDRIRSLCEQAMENARNDGRKTVLDRDFM